MIIQIIKTSILDLNKGPLKLITFNNLNFFTRQKPKIKVNDSKSTDNKQTKIQFGIKHPLQALMQKRVSKTIKDHFQNKKLYIKQKQQQQISKKPTQTQQDKNQSNKQNNTDNKAKTQMKGGPSLKNFIIALAFFILFSALGQNDRPRKQNERKNIDFILSEVQKGPEQAQVLVQRNNVNDINLICQIGVSKRYAIIVNEQQLVYFLNNLQKIRGGSTQVNFVSNYQPMRGELSSTLSSMATWFFYLSLIYIGYKVYKGFKSTNMGIGNLLGGKKFQPVKPQNIKIQFNDVAGMHEAKFQITQFVQFLKRPQKYIQMGAKVPKGALLTGPPGTGKTLLAKACAGQAGVPFFSVSGSDFVQKFSGLGASRVRSLFDEAQKNAPSIIFIDQIDAIGKKRDAGPFSNEQRDNTLNQLLVRMDGFDTKNKVIVMAATNRKDMLDPALLRPGRFDRSVQIGLPSLQQRAQILKVHLKKVKYQNSINQDQLAKKIARITPGFSGAQLANTCNQAAILAARQNIEYIPFQKFQKATQRVMAGLQKRNIFTPEQKQMLAFYEAGKAVANWFTEGADPVIKISILPFSKSKAGYSHSIKDETALHTKQQLLSKVCCYLAGRASQQHFKKHITTNGNKDLQRAKKIITMIVTKFGMSQQLKLFAFPDFDFTRKPYSEKTQQIIDSQISKISEECQNKIEKLIKQKQSQIIKIKQKLLQKQTLTHTDIKNILGNRPFSSGESYNQYLKDKEQEEKQKNQQGPGAGVATG